MQSQHQLNQHQYADKANNYLNSATHAQGIEFEKMQAVIEQYGLQHILDLGCGGGHVSYHLASLVKQITAYDLTPQMVELVQQQAQLQGFTNIIGQIGAAERLPFNAQSFDGIVTRYSAHHWQDVRQAFQEMHRVLQDNGKVIIVDVLGNANPILNNFLQTIETIRDPSHVKDYSLSEWLYFAENTGFRIQTIEKQRLTLDFASWTSRMHTPAEHCQVIRSLQHLASAEVKAYFDIQADGTFTTDVGYLVLEKY